MLLAGKHVTSSSEVLQPVSVERIYRGLVEPKSTLTDLVLQLRTLKTVDPNAYRKAKTMLPYFVCSQFGPPVRRKENFAYAEYFILDMDKLHKNELSVGQLKDRLKADPRIVLLFVSPGNDGLKALFRANERIYDSGIFSLFYRRFAASFARQYELESVLDMVTNDVSRCCFMSIDLEAYYNSDADLIIVQDYLQQEPSGINLDLRPVPVDLKEKAELGGGILQEIKSRLNPELAKWKHKEKEYIQPKELEEALVVLEVKLNKLGFKLESTKPISYGRQIRISAAPYWAEINLFYGKNGFKAIRTTKTGSNKELAEMGEQAIGLYLSTLTL